MYFVAENVPVDLFNGRLGYGSLSSRSLSATKLLYGILFLPLNKSTEAISAAELNNTPPPPIEQQPPPSPKTTPRCSSNNHPSIGRICLGGRSKQTSCSAKRPCDPTGWCEDVLPVHSGGPHDEVGKIRSAFAPLTRLIERDLFFSSRKTTGIYQYSCPYSKASLPNTAQNSTLSRLKTKLGDPKI